MSDRTVDIVKISNVLFSNREVDIVTDCWHYTGNIDPGIGYGRVMIDGERYHTHRLSAVLHLGLDINDSQAFVCHNCESRDCFNPAHLYIGDNKSNQLDAVNDRCKRGHLLSGYNAMIRRRPNGKLYRNCRMCHNTRTTVNRSGHSYKKG